MSLCAVFCFGDGDFPAGLFIFNSKPPSKQTFQSSRQILSGRPTVIRSWTSMISNTELRIRPCEWNYQARIRFRQSIMEPDTSKIEWVDRVEAAKRLSSTVAAVSSGFQDRCRLQRNFQPHKFGSAIMAGLKVSFGSELRAARRKTWRERTSRVFVLIGCCWGLHLKTTKFEHERNFFINWKVVNSNKTLQDGTKQT